MKFERVHHNTSQCVSDLARAKVFYGEVLGLEEIARPYFPFGGPGTAREGTSCT